MKDNSTYQKWATELSEATAFEKALRREKPADELEQAYRQGYMQGRKECDPRRSCSAERFANLVEEVADVLIMAQQMRCLISPERIDRIIDEKLNRQLRRIESET